MFIAELLLAVKVAPVELVIFSWLFVIGKFKVVALIENVAEAPVLVIAACCPLIVIVDEVAVNDFVLAKVLLFPEKVAVVDVRVQVPLFVNVV